jgi:2-methylaconitate cis-trans-isomerase PrpF
MIGPFALDEGLVGSSLCTHQASPDLHVATVRMFNTNTSKRIDCSFPVTASPPPRPQLSLPQTAIAGVPGRASAITLDFLYPGGARTGALLPTGRASDVLTLSPTHHIAASLVDATNPTVLIAEASLRSHLWSLTYSPGPSPSPPKHEDAPAIDYADPHVLHALESVRRAGAQLMGLDPSAQAQPKIAVLGAATPEDAHQNGVHIVVRALSMGVLHRAVPMVRTHILLSLTASTHSPFTWIRADCRVVHRRRRARPRERRARARRPGAGGGGDGPPPPPERDGRCRRRV